MSLHLPNTPVIETDRLTLRAFAAQDVATSQPFLTSERSKYMGGPYAPDAAWEHACSLIGHWAVHGFGLFSFCLKGTDTAIGDVGPFFPYGWPEHELGWGIWDAAHEGNGYAEEAAIAARAHAYGTLGWTTAVSYIDPDNAPSIALAKRLGCTLDKAAPLPQLPDWDGTLVYRHPSPEAL
ncbi:GNAT family N-acetyltransferase [Roseovarius sp. LXJ103]|uniref:GNAT family N-acetyltransferase n=1 Tax=Roseovarius carneus TaxID=2853164 RepID=UPI000D60E994|nr:GNAT family N-acetyltransferase [Roseovarius carneus]MBZ8118396.1 GNAT family N-acetyltransferase [Roseovarius carneus]PWE35898.1 N-acetyltransferase [Pelagicola sp. LXJ1103]